MSEQDAGREGERVVIHLVHGTRAEGAPWTTKDEPFRSRLVTRLREHGVHHDLAFTAPRWGGRNLQSAREDGAATVLEAVLDKRHEGARQFIIGHSHGGYVSLLACRDAEVAKGVDGVVCISTPFLVFRRAPYLRAFYGACFLAWWMVLMFGAIFLLDGVIPVMITGALFVGALVATLLPVLLWEDKHCYRDPEAKTASRPVGPPVLLLRSPGDEASGVLGASLVIERALLVIGGKCAAAWKLFLGYAIVMSIAVGFALAVLVFVLGLVGSDALTKWTLIVLAGLAALGLIAPLLVAVPLRIILSWISYGLDVATRGARVAVTAEAAPPGVWRVHTIVPETAEDRGPGFSAAHSALYADEQAIDAIAEWIRDRLKGAPSDD